MEDTEIRRKKKESLLSRIWENSDYAALAAVGALPTWFEFDPQFTFENISVASDGNQKEVTVGVAGYRNKYKVGLQRHTASTPVPDEEMSDEELYEWAWTRDDFKEYAQLDMEVGWLMEIEKKL
jgi:hypothetical protein